MKYHLGAYAETIRHFYSRDRLKKICVLRRGVQHLQSCYCDFHFAHLHSLCSRKDMKFIDQFQYTSSSAYSSMSESTTLSSTDYKAECLVEIHYKLHGRTEAKCIRTQDKSYTTLHTR